MPTTIHNISAFLKQATACLREYKATPEGKPTQAIKQLYSRRFLQDVGIEIEGPTHDEIAALPPAIFVANHASMLDALLICAFFDTDLRILAKSGLFRAPYIGRILQREKHICVYRGKNAHDRNRQIRDDIGAAIAEGASVFMFPEGTRTPDGAMHDFKLGAFFNAIQMQVPIIPVAIHGTFEAMPKTGIAIRPGKCKLEQLAPIAPPMNPSDERSAAETLALDTKKAIEAALGSKE